MRVSIPCKDEKNMLASQEKFNFSKVWKHAFLDLESDRSSSILGEWTLSRSGNACFHTLGILSVLPIILREKVSVEKCFFVGSLREEAHLLHSLFEKSQMRKDNDNKPSTAMNFEINRRWSVVIVFSYLRFFKQSA